MENLVKKRSQTSRSLEASRDDLGTILLTETAPSARLGAEPGGGGICSPDVRAKVQRRIEVVMRVRTALNEDRLVPYYQPKVCLRSGEIRGFETLARVRIHGGVLPAHRFAEAFDEAHLSAEITECLLDKVMQDVAAWTGSGCRFRHVAINLGDADFRLRDIVAEVDRRLRASGVPGSALQVEITESVFLHRSGRQMISVLERLKGLGVMIALDDFGTGYASLSHLKNYPVDILKIDRSFVRDMLTDQRSGCIVAAIAGLGNSLGLETVAEGVEGCEHVRLLRQAGCQTGQGYYFAKPMAGPQVPAFLEEWDETVSRSWAR